MNINKLIVQIEAVMKEAYVAQANWETPSDEIYYLAEETLEQGIGAVLVPTMQGKLKWLCLETLTF